MTEFIRNRLWHIRQQMILARGDKFTQAEMAAILDMTTEKYNALENNKVAVSFKRGLKIAKALNMPVENIFYLSEE